MFTVSSNIFAQTFQEVYILLNTGILNNTQLEKTPTS